MKIKEREEKVMKENIEMKNESPDNHKQNV